MDPDNKRIRFLHPLIASCYDTLEEVSSPVLDRLREEAEFSYLTDILRGKVRPQSSCPVCSGKRRLKVSRVVQFVNERPELAAKLHEPGDELHDWFVESLVRDCSECGGKGYVYPDDHVDYARADLIREHLDARLSSKGTRSRAKA